MIFNKEGGTDLVAGDSAEGWEMVSRRSPLPVVAQKLPTLCLSSDWRNSI
jgi:hypothetical protein